jgi:hypothetical protein
MNCNYTRNFRNEELCCEHQPETSLPNYRNQRSVCLSDVPLSAVLSVEGDVRVSVTVGTQFISR